MSQPPWEAFCSQSPFPMAATHGARHLVHYANRAFLELVDLPLEGVGNRPLERVLEGLSPRCGALLDEAAASGRAIERTRLHTLEEQPRHYSLSAWPVNTNGERQAMFVQIEPVATPWDQDSAAAEEIRQINGRLVLYALREQELKESAEAANRAKGDFLAIISHELRTPLTAIIGYADLMFVDGERPATDQQQHRLDCIKASAWHLRDLIDQTLTYAKMDLGQERVEKRNVGIESIAREVLEMAHPLVADKPLSLHLLTPRAPLSVNTDARKLRQVLGNLVTNAIKFTQRGRVELAVRRISNGVDFRVSDTGIGIAERDLERIFEPFMQVESGTSRSVGGTGLGLAVSRRITSMLGGELVVASTPGKGSEFTVRLFDSPGAAA